MSKKKKGKHTPSVSKPEVVEEAVLTGEENTSKEEVEMQNADSDADFVESTQEEDSDADIVENAQEEGYDADIIENVQEGDSDAVFVETSDIQEEVFDTDSDEMDAESINEDEGETAEENATIFEKKLTHTESKDSEFLEFLKEVGGKCTTWIKKNKVACAWGAGIFLVAVMVGILLSAALGGDNIPAMVSGNDASGNSVSQAVVLTVPDEPIQENAYPEVNELVNAYFAAMQNNDIETLRGLRSYIDTVEAVKIEVKSNYIEEYQNIVCYTKAGPFENSWIVYVCYDVKLIDWEQVAPSLLTLFVCTNESGELYIYSGDFDENVADYILATNAQEDVEALFNRVDTEYNEVMDANADFATYMSALNEVIKNEVGERLAAEAYAEENVALTASENVAVSENTAVSDNEAEALENVETEEETGPFEVEATTTVNVRASDSEEADRIGQVAGGTVLLCNEQQANGWSQIVFEDSENGIGYIKSEYLTVIGGEDGNVTESAEGVETSGTIRVSDTVNIRATADLDGERVGVAYQGETFEVVGDTDGEWIQIVYDGQLAYVNSDYVE